MVDNDDVLDVIRLISDIKYQKLVNSYDIAFRTIELLQSLISDVEWKTAQELMDLVKRRMTRIKTSLPHEFSSRNVMRHLLKLIREEYRSILKQKYGQKEGQSLQELEAADQGDVLDYSETLSNLKTYLLDQLAEYKAEMESSCENIANQASEHIYADDAIMTVGWSLTVETFLLTAAKTTTFEVVVAESSKVLEGHKMATNLANAGIDVTLIPDTNVGAVMSKVNKVIIDTDMVLANGGLRAQSGLSIVGLAAKEFRVPLIVLAHMYKFTPLHVGAHEGYLFDLLGSPADILPYASGPMMNTVEVYNPVFGYVPPELVALIITHQGANSPSYVYRILSELYHQDDYDI